MQLDTARWQKTSLLGDFFAIISLETKEEDNMKDLTKIYENIYYIGVNDRRTALFENLWPIPQGISYNSYLIRDEKNVLVDTVEAGRSGLFLDKLEAGLGGGKLDYLVLNHVEPDHSGALLEVLGAYPQVTVVGNKKTLGLIERFYGFDGDFLEVRDGDDLSLGKGSLSFTLTPMVHWPETMMTLHKPSGALFTGDAFGSFGTLDGAICDDELDPSRYEDEARRYFSNIVGSYSKMVQRALKKVQPLDVKMICPTHGLIWRKNPQMVLDWYDRWSKQEGEKGVVVVFGSMYGHTESMADDLARYLVEAGLGFVRVHDASKSHISYILSDIWKYQGVMLGSCAYNTRMLPTMDALCRKLASSGLAKRDLGIFGNYSWSGGGVKALTAWAEEVGWDLLDESIEAKSVIEESDQDKLDDLAQKMKERLS